ncbi:MAG: DUF1643 domain-containing protein [Pseudomonadota bacterium]
MGQIALFSGQFGAPRERKSAVFSPCRTWRYALWRVWGQAEAYCMWILINPSTADETDNDPTIRRCAGYARDLGFNAMCVTNLFAFVATSPVKMKRSWDPVGPDNDRWVMRLAKRAGMIIAGWGNDGKFAGRANEIRSMVPRIHCLHMTSIGEPGHPLYLKRALKPMELK